MLIVFSILDHLLTISTLLWFLHTLRFMIAKQSLFFFKVTILALHFSMSFFLVFFSFHLGYDISTLRTLVIISCATNFMHSKLLNINVSLTSLTFLCFNWCFLVYLRIRHILCKNLRNFKIRI